MTHENTLAAGIALGGLLSILAVAAAQGGCTPAERQVAVTDIGQFGPDLCVGIEAVAGADVPLIGELCHLAEDVVVAILDAEGLPSDDAGAPAMSTAAKITATLAYRTAEMRLAARRSMSHLR